MAGFSDFLKALGLGGKEGPNAYVDDNWPSDGRHAFHFTRPETFYTPGGLTPPPGGRGSTIGEDINGAPSIHKMMPFLSLLLDQYQRGER